MAVAIALVGCASRSLEQAVAADGLPPTAIARLQMDRAVAAKNDDGTVRVIEFRQEDSLWVRQVLAEARIGDAPSSVDLLSLGGETGDEWNTYIYGAAPGAVSRVEVAGYEGEGGRVVDGAWVIVLRQRDLTPADIEWRFVDAFGAVIESGAGIHPPPP